MNSERKRLKTILKESDFDSIENSPVEIKSILKNQLQKYRKYILMNCILSILMLLAIKVVFILKPDTTNENNFLWAVNPYANPYIPAIENYYFTGPAYVILITLTVITTMCIMYILDHVITCYRIKTHPKCFMKKYLKNYCKS